MREVADMIQERQNSDSEDSFWRGEEVLAMACHELRAPLASMQNAVRLLRKIPPGSAAGDEVHALLERQVRHLSRLVEDVMEISQSTKGTVQVRLALQRVDLRHILSRAIETMAPTIKAQGHRLEYKRPTDAAWTSADPLRLEQVFINLLSNAAKYTDPGGRITLWVEAQQHELVVGVRDSGIGMAPHVIPHVFEPFVRGKDKDAMARSGLGVGLAIVRNLAQMHGGSVAAVSPGLGHGSEFTVRLPQAE